MVPVCVHCKQIFIYIYIKKVLVFSYFIFHLWKVLYNSVSHIHRQIIVLTTSGQNVHKRSLVVQQREKTLCTRKITVHAGFGLTHCGLVTQYGKRSGLKCCFCFNFWLYWSQKSYLIHKKHSNPGWTLGQVMACCLTAPSHYSHHC